MWCTSLPKYHDYRRARPLAPNHPAPPCSARTARILFSLFLLVGLVFLFYSAKRLAHALKTGTPTVRTPLTFKQVRARYDDLHYAMSFVDVHELLGAPTPLGIEDKGWLHKLRQWEDDAARSRRDDKIPAWRHWDFWLDPRERSRGVAVLFVNDGVYAFRKMGF